MHGLRSAGHTWWGFTFQKTLPFLSHSSSSWWSVPYLGITHTASGRSAVPGSDRSQDTPLSQSQQGKPAEHAPGARSPEPPSRPRLRESARAGPAAQGGDAARRAARALGSAAAVVAGAGWRRGRGREGTRQPRERRGERGAGSASWRGAASSTAPAESPARRPRARARSAPAWRTAPQRAARPAALSPACTP